MSNKNLARPALLPVTYVEAKGALSKCARIDECKTWADKALALKSYAKQMNDSALEDMAQRIRDRAVQRGGELLAQIKAAKNQHDARARGAASPSRKEAAKAAGLSPDQAKQMLRVAKVPTDLFESMVEANKPATVEQLAKVGTVAKPKPKPWEHSDTWIEWISAIEHLSAMPKCGLSVLAAHDHRAHLKRECETAIKNLRTWRTALEKAK